MNMGPAMIDGTGLTAPAILFAIAEKHPTRVRFIENGRDEITYAQLADLVAAFAAQLRSRGVRRHDRVVLFGANSVAWCAAALAIQSCGAAFVSVHAGSSAELARKTIEHSLPRLVVFDPAEVSRSSLDLTTLGLPSLSLEQVVSPSTGSVWKDESALGDPACIIYTSGTTGEPKGVVLTHANLAANGADWITVCGPSVLGDGGDNDDNDDDDERREVIWLPFSHVFGWGDCCVGTLTGFTSMLAKPTDVPAALLSFRPHLLMTVPLLLERIVRAVGDRKTDDVAERSGATEAFSGGVGGGAPDDDDITLRAAFGGELRLGLCGGASLSTAIKRRLRRAGLVVLDGYGLTETSPTLTLERPLDEALGTVGRAYPQVELKIAEDGEVLARGPSVFSGYFRNESATRAAFDDDGGWFRTGDIGELTSSGHLRIVDRKKSLLVLTSGKKVAPQPIEVRAAESSWIERVVLFGEDRPCVVALVVPDAAAISAALGRSVRFPDLATDPVVRAGIAERIDALNATLSTFEVVKDFVIAPRPLSAEAGDLTPTLKVKREMVWKQFRTLIEPLWTKSSRREQAVEAREVTS